MIAYVITTNDYPAAVILDDAEFAETERARIHAKRLKEHADRGGLPGRHMMFTQCTPFIVTEKPPEEPAQRNETNL